MRPLWTFKSTRHLSGEEEIGLIGVPMWTQLTKVSVDGIDNSWIFLKLKDPNNDVVRAKLIDTLTISLNQRGAENINVVDEFVKT